MVCPSPVTLVAEGCAIRVKYPLSRMSVRSSGSCGRQPVHCGPAVRAIVDEGGDARAAGEVDQRGHEAVVAHAMDGGRQPHHAGAAHAATGGCQGRRLRRGARAG